MKIGSYNIRGLGSKIKKDEIHSFFINNKLDFCCVQETKIESFSDLVGRSIWKSASVGWYALGSRGRSGGILSFWDANKFLSSSQWSMGGAVVVNGRWCFSGEEYCIVNIYASCNLEEKILLWDRLSLVIEQNSRIKLCLIGDFNSILEDYERAGSGSGSSSRDRRKFKEFVENGQLHDVKLQGRKFTWYKPNGTCKSRIDRALINDSWNLRWQGTSLRGMKRSISDHCPILLNSSDADWGPKPFRFINAWLSHPDFMRVVDASWKEGGINGWGSFVFKEKLKRLKLKLKEWNSGCFGFLEQNIQSLREEIHALDMLDEASGLSEADACRRNEKSAQLLLLLNNRKSLLAQKAKFQWLKEGDVNSKLFHRSIKARRNSNGIAGLEVNGVWTEDPAQVKIAISDHFRNHFQQQLHSRIELPHNFVEARLDEADGVLLTKSFTEEEIRLAMWECEGSKSPGPDGFNFVFLRNCWSIIKEDLLRVLNEFHINSSLARGCNSSFIVLIPKKAGAGSIKEFRPISLIGSLYKVISKVLAMRLKSVLSKIISENQSAFLKGRYILDGVVALNEIIEDAKKSKRSLLIFKVDFAKAFDSVDWNYLLNMMKFMNFPEKWLMWMKTCITSASANVLVNGSPSGEFKFKRGIRQGDPLSPFLYLIAAEGLSLLTRRAISEGLIQAAVVGRQRLEVSHIQYADDTLFVVEGSTGNAEAIKWILKNFELISGLKVNFEKSSVFGINLDSQKMDEVAGILGCKVGSLPLPYLGLKVGGRINGIEGWSEVVERFKGRLRGWNAQSLSMGGRVTIINSILTALPLFCMSFLPLPKKVANQLSSLQRNFLWGGNLEAKKMAWLQWKVICKSKRAGGLGVKNLLLFNKALLCKWIWRFLVERESLWSRIIRARHGETFSGNKTGWWSKIIAMVGRSAGDWFWNNLSQKLGNGNLISFWSGSWAGDKPLKELFPRLYQLCANREGTVRNMGRWVNNRWSWEVPWRRALLDRELEWVEELYNHIHNFSVIDDTPDSWVWGSNNSNGIFSVRNAYTELSQRLMSSTNTEQPWSGFNHLWKSFAPLKAQLMAWRLVHNRLPTRDNLSKRFELAPDGKVCCCNLDLETAAHFFLQCTATYQIWCRMFVWIGAHWAPAGEIKSHFVQFSSLLGRGKFRKRLGSLWICVVWVLWRWRNAVIFDHKEWDLRRIEEEIKCRFWSWCVVRREVETNLSFEVWNKNPFLHFWNSAISL